MPDRRGDGLPFPIWIRCDDDLRGLGDRLLENGDSVKAGGIPRNERGGGKRFEIDASTSIHGWQIENAAEGRHDRARLTELAGVLLDVSHLVGAFEDE